MPLAKKNPLTMKQRAFVKNLTKGYNKKESAILAGYNKDSAAIMGSRLTKNEHIIKALEAAGLTDKYIAKQLKKNIRKGSGIKATADTAMKAIDLTMQLKGYKQTESQPSLNQTNVYINELKSMSIEDLQNELKTLQKSTKNVDISAL